MNSDVAFAGSPHHMVCQDYGLAGTTPVFGKPMSWAVLCDGCSSAPHADMGARLLAHAARANIVTLVEWGGIHSGSALDWLRACAYYARSAAGGLGVAVESLAATLLAGIVCERYTPEGHETVVRIVMGGDGVVVARARDGGRLSVYRVRYADETPLYPLYLTDRATLDRYIGDGHGDFVEESISVPLDPAAYKSPWHVNKRFADRYPFYLELRASEFDTVVLMTDGADAVRSASERTSALLDVVGELTAFKNTTGAFVQRRLQRAVRDFKGWGWSLGDDVGVAAIEVR